MTLTQEKPPTKQRYSRKQALANEPPWNDLQQNILATIEAGLNYNLRIGAAAGSGKSSVLSAIVNRLPTSARIAILSFNRHIAESMAAKVPSRVTATTAHSMGYGLLCRVFAGKADVDPAKYRKIARGVLREKINFSKWVDEKPQEKRLEGEAIDFLVEMVRACQSTLSAPEIGALEKLIDYYSVEVDFPKALSRQILGLVARCLDIGEAIAKDKQVIDFGDMLWLIDRWDIVVNPYDYVLIDEAMDANNAQLALYKRLVGDAGRLVAVGDPFQSIMGFSFSTPDMWQKVQRVFDTVDMPMSVCFRCPTSHLDLARIAVPTIRAADNAIQGEIKVVSPMAIRGEVKSGDLIICRFTAPLVSLCLKLIIQKVQAKVRGRDIGASLVALIDQATKSFSGFEANFTSYCNQRIEKLKASDQMAAADSLTDRMLAVLACYQHLGSQCSDLEQFKSKVQDLFSDESTPVILSTIHRAKGDEADRVWLLQPNVLPYVSKCQHEWQEQQERNLTYVALTRAKKTLFLVPVVRQKQGDDDASTKLDELLRDPLGGLDVETLAMGQPAIEYAPTPQPPSAPSEPLPPVEIHPFPFTDLETVSLTPLITAHELTELDHETLALADWFLNLTESTLPAPPFQLSLAVRVIGLGFYDALKFECQTVKDFADGSRAKRHPRHASGGLLRDLERLRGIVMPV